jgi:hypothetical protein
MKTKNNLLKSTRYIALFVIALACLFPSCSKKKDSAPQPSNTVNYSGNFVKSNAQVTTSASGTTTATFNTTTRELTFKLTWTGLGSAPVGMHFHDNGPIIIPIEGFSAAMSGTFSGKATLTAEQATDLAAGKIYSQIHTVNYPGGEVIATLTKSGGSNNPPPGNGY